MVNKTKYLFLFLILTLCVSCSFGNMGGIWSGSEEEKQRIADLERKQNVEIVKIYSSENVYSLEKVGKKNIILGAPKKINSWQTANLNIQNNIGNIYLSGIDNNFIKKKVGKNKFSIFKVTNSPLTFKNNIIFTDDSGTVFNLDHKGKLNWKKNIYTKMYKKIYKNLVLSIYNGRIYIADNVGFIYVLSLDSGQLIWIKNHGVPLRSDIKIFKDKIYVLNQDSRLLCLDIKNGNKIWDVRSLSSFIKVQNLQSIAITDEGDLITLGSSGDLSKIKSNTGQIYWKINPSGSTFVHDSDFFKSSDIVINKKDIIFFAGGFLFSINSEKGYVNWQHEITSKSTPIIDGNNIFLVSDNGYFVNIESSSGEIIWSTNILKILKKKKRMTQISGFIMGSGKIYVTTLNGYLIVCSASSGKVEDYKKIGNIISAAPIISHDSLYVLTEKPQLLGFN